MSLDTTGNFGELPELVIAKFQLSYIEEHDLLFSHNRFSFSVRRYIPNHFHENWLNRSLNDTLLSQLFSLGVHERTLGPGRKPIKSKGAVPLVRVDRTLR